MKKLMWVCAVAVSTMIFGACSVDTNDDSYATVSYWGVCDSIVFADTCDTVFGKYIYDVVASKNVPLTGDYSRFQESGHSTASSDQSAAISICNVQAVTTYDNMLKTATSSHIRSELAAFVGDTLDVDSLAAFKIYYSLYGFIRSSAQWISSYMKEY